MNTGDQPGRRISNAGFRICTERSRDILRIHWVPAPVPTFMWHSATNPVLSACSLPIKVLRHSRSILTSTRLQLHKRRHKRRFNLHLTLAKLTLFESVASHSRITSYRHSGEAMPALHEVEQRIPSLIKSNSASFFSSHVSALSMEREVLRGSTRLILESKVGLAREPLMFLDYHSLRPGEIQMLTTSSRI
jgi:hypothetical protein